MKKLDIRNQRVKVTAHFHEEGSVLRGDKQGHVDGFDVEVSFDTDEPEDVVREAIALAHRMCFTEAAITNAVPVKAKHIVNQKAL